MSTDLFVWENEVRDNETDFQGIVNNACYFVYLGFARYKHLKLLGVDIMALHARGVDVVLVRTEMDFKDSLRGGDEYIVTSKLEALGRLRLVFSQQILRKSDRKVMAEAKNTGVCVARSSGRPIVPAELKFLYALDKSN